MRSFAEGLPDALISVLPRAQFPCDAGLEAVPMIRLYEQDANCDHAIVPDSEALAEVVLDHYAQLGFTSIAVPLVDGHGWTEGIARALQDRAAKRRIGIHPLRCSGGNRRSWQRTMESWLRAAPAPIAVCAEPMLANGCRLACQRLGLLVPQQVSILALEDHEIEAAITRPMLSGVTWTGQGAGHRCAALLARLFTGEHVPPTVIRGGVGAIRERGSTERAIDDALVARACHLIHSSAGQRFGVADLLPHLGVSRRQLEQRFTSALGHSPLAEIRRMRTALAKRHLASESLAIAEVATLCGYGDANQFSRDFRRDVGLTPSAWRAEQGKP